MEHISIKQLFSLMFIFEVGSTTLFALGIGAKQDAWIVILLGLLTGIVVMYVFTYLQKGYPNKNFVEIMISILGKKLGYLLAFLYVWQTIWSNSRNLREFSDMICVTSLPETPLIAIVSVFMLFSIIILLKGVEVLARVSEIILPVLIFFLILVFILLYLSDVTDFKNLTPILGEGIFSIVKTLPSVAMFPFGELYIFLMYFQFVNKKEDIRKTGMKVVIISGLLLAVTLVFDIAVLGDKYASITTIPFLEAIRLIRVREVITNLDAIATMIIFYGGFFKMTIYMYGNVLIISSLVKFVSVKTLIFLYGVFLTFFSLFFEPDYAYHQWMSTFDTNFYGIYFTHVIPILLFLIFLIKRKRTQFK
ncbi:MAG: GerAB/ArcD/ProY family transporter [Clostridiaceae bacterium]